MALLGLPRPRQVWALLLIMKNMPLSNTHLPLHCYIRRLPPLSHEAPFLKTDMQSLRTLLASNSPVASRANWVTNFSRD